MNWRHKLQLETKKDVMEWIRWLIAVGLFVYSFLLCRDCGGYQIVDQYGREIPPEDLKLIVEAYNKQKYWDIQMQNTTDELTELLANISINGSQITGD